MSLIPVIEPTWYTLPTRSNIKYLVLSQLGTYVLTKYIINTNAPVTATANWLTGASDFSTWFTKNILGNGWDPFNSSSKSIYYIDWNIVMSQAVNYATPTLTAGQSVNDVWIVQVVQALINDFGPTPIYIAVNTQT